MAIHQTDMFHFNADKQRGGLIAPDYYFITDFSQLYKATSGNTANVISNVYVVASDFDRRYNVPKISGKMYYCIEANQLWTFDVSNMWKFEDGDVGTGYSDTGFFEGNFTFTKTYTSGAGSSTLPYTVKMCRIKDVVFGRVTAKRTATGTKVAIIPADFSPNTNINVVLEVDKDTRVNATLTLPTTNNTADSELIVDAGDIDKLNTNTHFWYVMNKY